MRLGNEVGCIPGGWGWWERNELANKEGVPAGDVYGNLMMTRVLRMRKDEAEEVCKRRAEINASGVHHVYHYQ